MDRKTTPSQRWLQQQQPQRPVNRQQQQSSGSSEFQPSRLRQAGEETDPARPENAGMQQ
jgi:type IV secretory pathway VirB9-like protein